MCLAKSKILHHLTIQEGDGPYGEENTNTGSDFCFDMRIDFKHVLKMKVKHAKENFNGNQCNND